MFVTPTRTAAGPPDWARLAASLSALVGATELVVHVSVVGAHGCDEGAAAVLFVRAADDGAARQLVRALLASVVGAPDAHGLDVWSPETATVSRAVAAASGHDRSVTLQALGLADPW